MKKKSGLFLLIALVAVLAVGCGEKETKNNTTTKDIEAALKTAATEYYNEYQKGVIGQDYNEITLDMLKKVNESSDAGYDLSALEGCEDDTKVTIQADENRNIVDYKYELNCK